ncbi:MAG: glycosyltransferase family 2 protein [Bacteroidales bacterium]|nr:glycosyltransferase family 2 protein [Bacteroidales bacterium]MCF8377211.1 glycosyltransferase family 2 protein [Bacteroidales bacterium]MCF8401082.1 glycosyltransferase family 2 protein [Bacteroidales bacterium]
MDISVVIPAHNEEDNIPVLYSELTEALSVYKDYEIIIVNDGSSDNTFGVCKEINGRDERFKIIQFRKNYGQSAALAAGFDYASGDVIVSMDGDLQNDPMDIPRLVAKLEEGFDAVSGWRYNRKDKPFKKISSRFGRLLRKIVLKDQIHDSGCTLKAYRKNVIKETELLGEMHRYIAEILTLNGHKITELKVNHRPRTAGKTKYSMGKLPRGFLDLLIIAFQMRYATRPVHLFGGIGLLSIVIGLLIGIYLIIVKYGYGQDIGNRPMLLLSVLLLIVGLQFIILGIMADLLIKIYYRDGKKDYKINEIVE